MTAVPTENPGMTDPYDNRDRPVVYETKAESGPRRPRWYGRALAGVGGTAAALAAATGIVLGGSALWSALDTTPPGNAPAPLWFPPPPQVTAPTSEEHHTTNSPDDPSEPRHSTVDSQENASSRQVPEPGDDRSGSGGRGRSPGGPSGGG